MAKLSVMTQPCFNGMVAMYIRDRVGLKRPVWMSKSGVFNGATANEALAAGLWDLGFQGATYVFGVINTNAKL